MKKSIISLLLIMVMMVALFAGCGAKDTNSGSTTETASKDESKTESSDTKVDSEKKEAPTQLKIVMFAAGDAGDLDLVTEEINKIAREKVNVEVQIDLINFGSYRQQTNLMLSSGEKLDIMPTFFTPTLASYVSSGLFTPLDDLLAERGQGILEQVPNSGLACGEITGKVFGIPNKKEWAVSYGFAYRKDLGDKYGIDPASIKTLDDVEAVLRIIKENEPDISPLVPQNSSVLVTSWDQIDNLGDGNYLGTLPDGVDELTVINYFESDTFKNFVTRTRTWYEDGLIMRDILNNTETSSSLVKNGKGFGYLSNTKPGFDAQESRATGREMVVVELVDSFSTTSNIQNICWTIPINSENPEKAMDFLNLMYSDPDISNLMIYGVEGVHYKFVDEANGIIDYADGVDASNSGYPGGTGWGWANQFISHVWNGNPADYWTQYDDFNSNAKLSAALGFVFSSDNVSTEMAACASVIDQYLNALKAGVVDPEETLPLFNKDLKDAGIEVIIAEKQKQLDEWVANK